MVALPEGGVVGLTKEVAVGATVAVGVKVEVGEGVIGAGVSVVAGVGLDC